MAVSSRRFKSKYNIARLIDELQKMCLGTLFVAEDGVITFELYDAAASAARTLTEDDVFDVRVETTYGNLVNRIAFLLADSTELYQGGWTMKDTASETNFTPPSGSAYVAEATVEFGLLKPRFKPAAPIFTTSATDIKLKDGDIMSLCGMRGSDNPGSQPADAKISAARPLYLRIATEIIKETTALTINTTDGQAFPVTVDENGKVSTTAGTGYYSSCTLASGGMTRASLGTTAVWHPDASDLDNGDVISWKTFQSEQPIQDLTIPERWGRLQLARFSNGCPILSFKTSLRHYDLQIGDVIALEHQLYAHYGDVEADSNTTWEIINKEVDLMKGECYFKVARIARTGGTSVTSGYVMISPLNAQSATHSMLRAQQQLRGGQAYIQGMKLATASGLTFTVDKGTACIGMQVYRYPEKITFTVAASKDTYVYVDQFNGSIVMNAVANGAARPTNDENWIIIGKVVSGGAATSSVVYLANTKPHTAAQAALNGLMSEQFVANGDFGVWSAGSIMPPDGWFIFSNGTAVTTDPVLESPDSWGTGFTKVYGDSYVGDAAVNFDSSTSGATYSYFMQTDVVPIRYGHYYDFIGQCTADNGGSKTLTVRSCMAEYDENHVFLGWTKVSSGDTGAGTVGAGTALGSWLSGMTPTNATARYARFGYEFQLGAGGTAIDISFDNIKGYIPVPRVTGTRSSDQTGIVTSTWTDLDYNSTSAYPRWGMLVSDVFTAPLGGSYKIASRVEFISVADGTLLKMRLVDSGGTVLQEMASKHNSTGGAVTLALHGTALYTCAAGQTFKVQVWHNHGSDRSLTGGATEFWTTVAMDGTTSPI
jgi:hypothetical protein